jgi:hypothetical protein
VLLAQIAAAGASAFEELRFVAGVVQGNASLARAYRLFRTMGLHHMFVGAPKPQVLGIITRKVGAFLAAHDARLAGECSISRDTVVLCFVCREGCWCWQCSLG